VLKVLQVLQALMVAQVHLALQEAQALMVAQVLLVLQA
jgi:hypothetical protein